MFSLDLPEELQLLVESDGAEKLYRDVKAMSLVPGTGQIQRVIIARHRFQLPSG